MPIVFPRPPISFPVGTNVTFRCEASGYRSAVWEVDGTPLGGTATQTSFANNRGIITTLWTFLPENGNISYTLYALASVVNNGTVIRCQVTEGPPAPVFVSDPVTLLVFGEC